MEERPMIYHDLEAYAFAEGVTDPRARGALVCLRQVLLECFGAPLHFLSGRCRPAVPLDNLVFYRAVAEAFATWDETETNCGALHVEDLHFINIEQAIQLTNSLPQQRANSILRHFIRAFTEIAISPNAKIDLEFCCRIVVAFLIRDEVTDNILSGATAEDLEQYKRNPDDWIARAWFHTG